MLLLWLVCACLAQAALGQRGRPNQPPAPPSSRASPGQGNADILTQVSDISPDGTFYTKYETANGIQFEERGELKADGAEGAASVQGSFSYTADDGSPIQLSYAADENGFQPQGAHLPTPPPIPEGIQRALEWIAANPSKDDEDQAEGNRLAAPAGPQLTQRRPPPRNSFQG